MNGSVFPSFHPIIIRKNSAAHASGYIPTLLAGGSLSLQATSTGQLNTILTLYEIANPPVSSVLSGIPESLLRNAIAILAKSGRAQLISIADGDGVRLFLRSVK